MTTEAIKNRQEIEAIKQAYLTNQISRETAKELAQPIIDRINNKMASIAKKYNKKPQTVTFIGLMR